MSHMDQMPKLRENIAARSIAISSARVSKRRSSERYAAITRNLASDGCDTSVGSAAHTQSASTVLSLQFVGLRFILERT